MALRSLLWLVALMAASVLLLAAPAFAAFPGADGPIAFVRFAPDADIYRVDLDGGNEVNLTNAPGSNEVAPSWDPSGDRFAFASDRDGSFDLFTASWDGSDLRQITSGPESDLLPAFCDEETIVYQSTDAAGNRDVYLVKTDGTGKVRLTSDAAFEGIPTCRPDGQRIAYVTDRDGNFEIYEMGLDGGNQVNLTQHPASDSDPDYAPDGGQLAFSSDRDGQNFEIFVMDLPGGSPVAQVTALGPGEDAVFPAFFPSRGSAAAFPARASGLRRSPQGKALFEGTFTVDLDSGRTIRTSPDSLVAVGQDGESAPRPTCHVDPGDDVFLGQLIIDGTDGNDRIEVRAEAFVPGTGPAEFFVEFKDGDGKVLERKGPFLAGEGGGRIGRVVINANAGDDVVVTELPVLEANRRVEVYLGPGDDVYEGLLLSGVVLGGRGDDSITATFDQTPPAPPRASAALPPRALHGGATAGKLTLSGGSGNDTIRASGSTPATARVRLTFLGGPGNDTLVGGTRGEVMNGGGGRDRLFGRAGNDVLLGGSGRDLLNGGPGRDTLDGGPGNDRCTRGERVRRC